MKTLKNEEIHCRQYRDIDELRLRIDDFLENYYNQRRLHSALGYVPPEEFEAAAAAKPQPATLAALAPTIRYFRPPKRRAKRSGQPSNRTEHAT